MKKCPNCYKIYPDDTMYCPKDNYRLIRDESIKDKVSHEGSYDGGSYKVCPHCQKHFKLYQEKCPDCNLYLETRRNSNGNPNCNTTNTIKMSSYNIPKCPTCGSTNIRRISTAEKATGVILFGIFSNKRKYQFECQNPKCKYKW